MIHRRDCAGTRKEIGMADTRGRSAGGAAFMRERYGIDEATAQSLLDAALSRGGEHAELFFEHRDGSQHHVRAAGREDAPAAASARASASASSWARRSATPTREDLSRDAMRRAADTAARIASRGDKAPPVDVVHYESANYYSPDGQHRRRRRRRTRSTSSAAPTTPRAPTTPASRASTSTSSTS